MTDFPAHLGRQLQFLHQSCASYDGGFFDEAIRMATVMRVLLHDTKHSTSLLKHLGRSTIELLTTCRQVPSSAVYFEGLGQFQSSGSETSYYAPLGEVPTKGLLPAPAWWGQIVSILGSGVLIRRRDIILGAANKDGGAHVDQKLTPEYAALTADGAVADVVYKVEDLETKVPITNAHFVYLRQMGYELLNSPQLRAMASRS